MSTTYLIISLLVSILIIVILITKLKLNAALSLVIGSLVMGFMTKMQVVDIVDGINAGFGNMMASIGFSIGFGIILGQLLSDCGGANVIADKLVKIFPESKSVYAVALAGFVLSIPVFFDVTFVILIPIAVALMKKTKKNIAYMVGAISIGAGIAHSLVPPTPNPLAAAEILNFDLGIMIAVGGILGLIAVIITVTIYIKILDRGLWNKEKDESEKGINLEEQKLPDNQPSFFVSLIPIFLPIIAILLNTATEAAMGDAQPAIFQFIGSKTVSMLIGALAAYVIAIKTMGSKAANNSASKSLDSAGIVFLITGAGGSLAKIIDLSGVNNAIVDMISNIGTNVIVILLICWILGVLFRQITGSGTVAGLTTMTMMASVASTVAIHPVFIAMACLSGGMFGATVNDSGFWIVSNMAGLNFSGGVKTYTIGEAIASVVMLVLIVAAALVYIAVF